jgi:hypothetical protein
MASCDHAISGKIVMAITKFADVPMTTKDLAACFGGPMPTTPLHNNHEWAPRAEKPPAAEKGATV